MEYGRARRWSRAVAGLFLAKPEDFIQCWEDQRMSKGESSLNPPLSFISFLK
jgi:hypothetical protein